MFFDEFPQDEYLMDKMLYPDVFDEDEVGECEICNEPYFVYDRDGRCGSCGCCSAHCDHEEEEELREDFGFFGEIGLWD